MKNNLISILAYAEQKKCEKIIEFVNDIMEDGGLSISTIVNSGNIVIDSLIGYWYEIRKVQKCTACVKASLKKWQRKQMLSISWINWYW